MPDLIIGTDDCPECSVVKIDRMWDSLTSREKARVWGWLIDQGLVEMDADPNELTFPFRVPSEVLERD